LRLTNASALLRDEESQHASGNQTACGAATLLALSTAIAVAVPATKPHPGPGGVTLAVTMTNDPAGNQVKVYDVSTQALLQTLPTNGAGGVGGNALGVRQFQQ
jgi:hypothetical protein